MQTIVQGGHTVDISNGLCCHLAILFLTDEDSVSLLQIGLTILDQSGRLNFDIDLLVRFAVLAVELQPDLAVF
jgi:hypothetical protein